MPPLGSASKSKNKVKDARVPRSRNTTPSAVVSAAAAAAAPPAPPTTPFLQLDTSKLLVGAQPSYADILDRLETKPANLEPKLLQDIIEQLKQLSEAAEKRVDTCEKAIRIIHDQLKDLESEHKERERQAEHHRKLQAKKDESQSSKNLKAKKRKDREQAEVEIKREGMSTCRHCPVIGDVHCTGQMKVQFVVVYAWRGAPPTSLPFQQTNMALR